MGATGPVGGPILGRRSWFIFWSLKMEPKTKVSATCLPNVRVSQSTDRRAASRNLDRAATTPGLADHHTWLLTDVPKPVSRDHSSQRALRFARACPLTARHWKRKVSG